MQAIQRPTRCARETAGVPRDLETICLKCLEKTPEKRYASAAALAENLRRFQRDEPIGARQTSSLERALKWVRRRPAHAALFALSCVAVALLAGGVAWYEVRDRRTRRNFRGAHAASDGGAHGEETWPGANTWRSFARPGRNGIGTPRIARWIYLPPSNPTARTTRVGSSGTSCSIGPHTAKHLVPTGLSACAVALGRTINCWPSAAAAADQPLEPSPGRRMAF